MTYILLRSALLILRRTKGFLIPSESLPLAGRVGGGRCVDTQWPKQAHQSQCLKGFVMIRLLHARQPAKNIEQPHKHAQWTLGLWPRPENTGMQATPEESSDVLFDLKLDGQYIMMYHDTS